MEQLAGERQDLDVQECQARDQQAQLRETIARGANHVEDKEVALEDIAETGRGVEQTPGLHTEKACRSRKSEFFGQSRYATNNGTEYTPRIYNPRTCHHSIRPKIHRNRPKLPI